LPPSWTTLYELTKLDDDTFDQKLHDGTINPEMQRKDVARQNRILSRERDRRRVENLAPIWGTAKRGEQVGAITARSAGDPEEDPKTSDGTARISLPYAGIRIRLLWYFFQKADSQSGSRAWASR
jgi:hypothetical protein